MSYAGLFLGEGIVSDRLVERIDELVAQSEKKRFGENRFRNGRDDLPNKLIIAFQALEKELLGVDHETGKIPENFTPSARESAALDVLEELYRAAKAMRLNVDYIEFDGSTDIQRSVQALRQKCELNIA